MEMTGVLLICAVLLCEAASQNLYYQYNVAADDQGTLPPTPSKTMEENAVDSSEVTYWLPGVPKGDLDLARDAIEADSSLSSHLRAIINDTYGGDVSHVRHILEVIATFSQQSVVERALLNLISIMADNDDLVTNELVVFSQEVLRYINDTDSTKLKYLYSQLQVPLAQVIVLYARQIREGYMDNFLHLCVDSLQACESVLPDVTSLYLGDVAKFISSLEHESTKCLALKALVSTASLYSDEQLQQVAEITPLKCRDLLKLLSNTKDGDVNLV